jgi:hypothetical protein
MSYSDSYTSSPFDQALADIPDLTWVPWVGTKYAELPDGKRVLIVAESHYTDEQDPEKIPQWMEGAMSDKTFTRAIVTEGLIDCDWPNRTFATMHQLFYGPADRKAFWTNLAFYNIVQRPMWYRTGNPERPTWEDFWNGWKPFLKVVEILKPDHVLFIGVEASNHFNGFMSQNGHAYDAIKWVKKIGSAYARAASLLVNDRQTPLHFIRHCGSYFSTELWSDYLHRNAPDLMAAIASAAGVKPRVVSPRQLHVLGMAKSSLDLRGAKAPKLELDFLRLAYAVRDLREAGEEAVGYLMVLVPKVAKAVERWQDKYSSGEGVVVLCKELEGENLESLIKEKADNAIGFIIDRQFDEAERELSLADLGKKLGETALHQEISARHPGLISSQSFPLGIQWDYYGTLDTVN